MDSVVLAKALRLARSAERLGCLTPGDWPDVAVALLLEGIEDAEVAELAGLDGQASGWTVDPLAAALYERYSVPDPTADDCVLALAGLMAADFRARPAAVTDSMIRVLAGLAQPCNFESSLANEYYGAEEYLDCDCSGRPDPALEAELEMISGPLLPDGLVRVLAAPLRASLPLVQPPRGH